MDSRKEDKYGMFLKMESFLTARAALLSVNPAYADILTELTANDLAITQADSTANRNLTGLTINKEEKRTTLETAILTVGGAARGYYTTNHDPYKTKIVTLTRTKIDREADTELISQADKVHDVADPIKTLLAPWNVTAADVDNLLVLVNAYRPTIVEKSRETDVSVVANVEMDKLFADNDTLLTEQFDEQFAVYEFTNNSLYLEGQLARAIDDSGGNSGTEGFNVQTFTVPGNGSILVDVSPGPLPADQQIYIRAVQGDLIICTTNLPASPCTSGYDALQGETYKGPLSGLSINLALTTLQITNPGLSAAILRVGMPQ